MSSEQCSSQRSLIWGWFLMPDNAVSPVFLLSICKYCLGGIKRGTQSNVINTILYCYNFTNTKTWKREQLNKIVVVTDFIGQAKCSWRCIEVAFWASLLPPKSLKCFIQKPYELGSLNIDRMFLKILQPKLEKKH